MFFYKCVNLGKIFLNEIYLFIFEKIMKNITMVKVGYFCMGQKMMWNELVQSANITYDEPIKELVTKKSYLPTYAYLPTHS
jgi:hypothetical protein